MTATFVVALMNLENDTKPAIQVRWRFRFRGAKTLSKGFLRQGMQNDLAIVADLAYFSSAMSISICNSFIVPAVTPSVRNDFRSSVVIFALTTVNLFVLWASALSQESGFRAAIDQADLERHAHTLANDTFEGREAGSRGGRAAGVYIAKRLAELGIRGGGDRGYFQDFEGAQRNILGVIDASDESLEREWIIIGAHYDHVGYGNKRNSYGPFGLIHNGADDNASGVAALLEIAEAFSSEEGRPRRNVLLAFWDGEEKGLLGSKHWIAHPTVPIQRVKFYLNLDMVGRLGPAGIEVYGSRTATGLRKLVAESNAQSGLNMQFLWKISEDSDHWTFIDRHIPSLMIHTGLHSDYHRPSDDADKLNIPGMETVTELIHNTALHIDRLNSIPGFRAQSQFENEDGRAELEKPEPTSPRRLGVSWRLDPGRKGLLVTKVDQGSPAALAGIFRGDRIIQFEGQEIRDERAFRRAVMTADRPIQFQISTSSGARDLEVALAGPPTSIGVGWRNDDAEPGVAVVVRVVPGTPAEAADLRVGDRIYSKRNSAPMAFSDFASGSTESDWTVDGERNGIPMRFIFNGRGGSVDEESE